MKLIFVLPLLWSATLLADANESAEQLTRACRLGDFKMAGTLLSAGVSADARDRYGLTPLDYAASFNQTKIVDLLLFHHADPNLHDAERGARVNGRSDAIETPGTPLQYASSRGNLRITEMLVAAGAHVNAKTTGGQTALHFAVLGRHLDVMQFLIEEGADVNVRDANGTSAMDDATWRGDLDSIAILLAHGAHLNDAEPKTGATPINEAAYVSNNTAVVRYLLQFHPDLGIPDKRGYTPLENAARKGGESCALLLLEAVDKERQGTDVFEHTVDAAISKDESLLVKALVRHGVSADSTLASGSTLLDAAAFTGATKTVEVLLEEKADPNKTGNNGSSPLEDASLKGYEAIAGLLLDHGALANQANPVSGATPLYTAASFGKVNVVDLLLSRGANPNLCGKNQKSAYQAAIENGFAEVAAKIKNHGGAQSCRSSL